MDNIDYSADNIQVMTLGEAIRKRPEMYIGGENRCGIWEKEGNILRKWKKICADLSKNQ